MKRAEIEANARKPYADAILKVTQEKDRYRAALERIAAYQTRGPVAAAQLIALAAIELRETMSCVDSGGNQQ